MRLAALTVALTVALAAIAAAGCRALTEPNAVDIRFSSYIVSVPAVDSQVEAITATGTTGAIVVVGQLKTQSACFALTPRVRRAGATIVAVIEAREAVAGCDAGPALYGYLLRIGRLSPGDYQLSIEYDVASPMSSTVWTPIDATLHVL